MIGWPECIRSLCEMAWQTNQKLLKSFDSLTARPHQSLCGLYNFIEPRLYAVVSSMDKRKNKFVNMIESRGPLEYKCCTHA